MPGSTSLFAIIMLSFVVSFVLRRFGTPGMRLAMDRLSKRGTLNTNPISEIGAARPTHSTLGRNTMPLTSGLRVMTSIIAMTLLYALNQYGDNPEMSPIPTEYFWHCYIGFSALIAWHLGHIWTYQLELDGTLLTVPTWGFRARQFDLSGLIRIEDDGQHQMRLYFEDGSRAEILKHVRGRPALLKTLQSYAPMQVA